MKMSKKVWKKYVKNQVLQSIDPFYSESNINTLNKSIKQLEEGKIIEKTLEELKEMENE